MVVVAAYNNFLLLYDQMMDDEVRECREKILVCVILRRR